MNAANMNTVREAFTVSERVAIAAAVAERLKGRNHRPEKHGNISTLTDQGATRDLAAALLASAARIVRMTLVCMAVVAVPSACTVLTGYAPIDCEKAFCD